MINLDTILSKFSSLTSELNLLMDECAMKKDDDLPMQIMKYIDNVYIDAYKLLYSMNTINSVSEFSQLFNNNENENNNNDDKNDEYY